MKRGTWAPELAPKEGIGMLPARLLVGAAGMTGPEVASVVPGLGISSPPTETDMEGVGICAGSSFDPAAADPAEEGTGILN